MIDDARDPADLQVGQRLRSRRIDQAVTQRALAKALGVTPQQVHKIERGRNRVAFSTLARAAEHLKTTVADLVGETDEGADPLIDLLTKTRLARELLAAYAGIEDANARRGLVELAEALARASDGQGVASRA